MIYPTTHGEVIEHLTALLDTDRTNALTEQARLLQRISRLEQRFAQLSTASRGPRTPDPLPANTVPPPINETAPESVRVAFTLCNQIKAFRDAGGKPIPTRDLHIQSGLALNIINYGRYLREYLREYHPDLATGPRRILDKGKQTQLRCLHIVNTDPRPSTRVANPETLARQITQFREHNCQPTLAVQMWHNTTISISRHLYLRDLKRFIAEQHPDLELRHRPVINPKTRRPFATPWLVHRQSTDV